MGSWVRKGGKRWPWGSRAEFVLEVEADRVHPSRVVRTQAFSQVGVNMVKSISLQKEARKRTADSSTGCGPDSLAGRRRLGQRATFPHWVPLVHFLEPWVIPVGHSLFLSSFFLRLVQWADCRAACFSLAGDAQPCWKILGSELSPSSSSEMTESHVQCPPGRGTVCASVWQLCFLLTISNLHRPWEMPHFGLGNVSP